MNPVPALDLRPANDARQLPANIDAECALLGLLLYDNAAFERIGDFLRGEHFFEGFNGRLFGVIEGHIRRGQLAEPILLAEQFTRDPVFAQLGGVQYLADLVDRAPPSHTAPDYARVVWDMARRREMIRIGEQMAADARHVDIEEPSGDLIERAEGELYSLAETGQASQGFVAFEIALSGALAMAAEAYSRDGAMSGLSTGLLDLDRKTGGLHPSDLVIIAGRPSMGKAQPLDAKVLLRDGSWKAMGDLRLGDDLASTDGAASRVAGVYPQGDRQVYRVRLSDGRSARACAEHLWLINTSKVAGGSQVVSTQRLAEMMRGVRYQRRVSLPLVSGHFGEDRDLLINPWVMGAMIGNGCMSPGHLSFSTADSATLYRLQKVVGHEAVTATGTNGYDYRISRKADPGLFQALKAYGLDGKLSVDKFIPPAYLAANRESRLELLRGLMDTDGWVETFGVLRYSTVSPRLASDVQALVWSLGGTCTIATKAPRYTHNGEKRDGQTAYTLNISHPDRASLVSLKRKQRRCLEGARFRAPSIVAVEPEGVEPVQCIRVTHPSSLYVTDDYVVTHNTSLATNIAFAVARHYAYEPTPEGGRKTVSGGVVGFFSLEMSEEQLAMRVLSEVAGVSGDRIRKGEIDALEFGRLREASIEIASAPLHIDATGGITVAKLAARARRLKRTSGLDLIVVDYLQLMSSGQRTNNRVEEITLITIGLKALAKELGVPIIALSQLSRQVETREDKKPQLSDLRESGSIEQDADMVMFVYREEYYLARTEPRADSPEHLAWQEQMDQCRGLAELVIGKQRHGPIGTVRLSFNEDLTKFGNLARESHYGAQASYRNPTGERGGKEAPAVGPAGIRLHRAGRRHGDVCLSRGILPRPDRAAGR